MFKFEQMQLSDVKSVFVEYASFHIEAEEKEVKWCMENAHGCFCLTLRLRENELVVVMGLTYKPNSAKLV